MVNEAKRKAALDRIRKNIARSGHHVYSVLGGATPRFAYTIGVSESIGAALILAGTYFYLNGEVTPIINDIAEQFKPQHDRVVFEVGGRGTIRLRKAESSWAAECAL